MQIDCSGESNDSSRLHLTNTWPLPLSTFEQLLSCSDSKWWINSQTTDTAVMLISNPQLYVNMWQWLRPTRHLYSCLDTVNIMDNSHFSQWFSVYFIHLFIRNYLPSSCFTVFASTHPSYLALLAVDSIGRFLPFSRKLLSSLISNSLPVVMWLLVSVFLSLLATGLNNQFLEMKQISQSCAYNSKSCAFAARKD